MCAKGFCKKVKENLQLCVQRPTAVCADLKDLKGSVSECANQTVILQQVE